MPLVQPNNQDYLTNLSIYFLLIAFLTAIFLHWQNLNGGLLSDSYAIYATCYNLQQEGHLWSTIFSQFYVGLSNGAIDVYRPLVFVSFCAEYSLFGHSPLVFKSIQLGLHISNSFLLYLLLKTLFKPHNKHQLMAVFSAIFFLFSPVSPEVSMWVAARFDVMAQFFILLTCLFHCKNKVILAVMSMILALCSKEAAIVLPVMLFTMSFFKAQNVFKNFIARIFEALKQTWIYWLLILIYMGMRFYLFDGAFHVYQQDKSTLEALIHNLSVFPQVFSNLALAAWSKSQLVVWFWLVLFALMSLSLFSSLSKKADAQVLSQWLMFFSWILITLLALVSQIGTRDATGAGARVLYSVSAWFAVLVAMPLLILDRKYVLIFIAYALFLIYVQSLPLKQWSQAAETSKNLLKSLKQLAPLPQPQQWSMVLIPENIGVALLGRNAQGGFSLPPFREKNSMQEMMPFIRTDLELWRQRIKQNFVTEFKKNADNPNQYPSRYYCTHKDGHILALKISPEDLISPTNWANKWLLQTAELDCYF